MTPQSRHGLLRSCALCAILLSGAVRAEEALPTVEVTAPALQPSGGGGSGGPSAGGASAGGASAGGAWASGQDGVSPGAPTGYNVPNAVSATKTDTPIRDTPFAVQVVPASTMRDQQETRLQDAILGNVSSVAPNGNGWSDNTNFNIRGFNTGPNVYQDGLLVPYLQNVDVANIQSIEVLKGPAASLYGRMPPGGLVNYISKVPLETPYYAVQETLGSYGMTRTSIDMTGPLDGKTLLYRINADFERTDSFVNYENARNILVAPAITWRPSDRFQFTLQGLYHYVANVDSTPNFPAFGNRPAPIPISTYLEDPGVTQAQPDTMKREYVGYNWTWKLDNDWQITNRFAYNALQQHVTNMYFSSVDNAGNGVNGLQYGPAAETTLSTNIDLTGKVQTGPFNNALLLGADYLQFRSVFNGIYDSAAQNINIFNPQAAYYTINLANELNPANGYGFALLGKQEWRGVYAQDMISFLDDRVHLLIGGRYDWANTGSGFAIFDPTAWADANAGYASAKDGGFSPRIGLSVKVAPWATVYGNYTRALGLSNVTAGVTTTGAALGPQWGTQQEVGVKTEFFDKRLSATIAWYNIVESNVPVAINGMPGVYNLAGQEQSQGVELDVTGKVNDNWSVIATYSHDIAKVTQGYAATAANIASELPVIGSALPGVPVNMGSGWAKYTGDGALHGWQFASGLSLVSEAVGDNANSFQMPGYALLRGMANYSFKIDGKKVTAQLNIDNALNRTYFYGTTAYSNRFSMTPGTPRALMGTVRVEF